MQDGMGRRDFLKAAGAGAAAAAMGAGGAGAFSGEKGGPVVRFQESYDVLVAGAGVAGVAAAVASAQSGARTALIEKMVLVGGLATAGLIGSYPALCDGHGNQVTYGLAEKMLHLSIRYGPGDIPAGWGGKPGKRTRRYAVVFSPAAFALGLDELLQSTAVDLWLDVLVCVPEMEGDRVAGFEVESKTGRGLLRARCVVDATGDADVACRAGAPCEEAGNWLTFGALEASLERAREAVRAGSGAPLLSDSGIGASFTGEGQPEGVRKFRGTDGREVTEFVLKGRELLRRRYAQRQAEIGPEGRKDVFPLTLPSMAQFRTTRRIEGQTTVDDKMAWHHFDDSVGLVGDFGPQGGVWEVPYGALLPRKVTGLLAAGRCISSSGRAWDVMRVIQAAAHTGEIAGVAASLAVKAGTTPDALDLRDVRAALEARGIRHDSRQVPSHP